MIGLLIQLYRCREDVYASAVLFTPRPIQRLTFGESLADIARSTNLLTYLLTYLFIYLFKCNNKFYFSSVSYGRWRTVALSLMSRTIALMQMGRSSVELCLGAKYQFGRASAPSPCLTTSPKKQFSLANQLAAQIGFRLHSHTAKATNGCEGVSSTPTAWKKVVVEYLT